MRRTTARRPSELPEAIEVLKQVWLCLLLHGPGATLHSDRVDLTLRQVAIVLTVYLEREPQTVRGPARGLQVPGPSVSGSADRLVELGLIGRRDDPEDRRSVIISATPDGTALAVAMLRLLPGRFRAGQDLWTLKASGRPREGDR